MHLNYLRLLLLPFIICFFGRIQAQDSSLLAARPYVEIMMPVKLFTTDPLQQVYLVNDKNLLLKYNTEGSELGRFSNIRLGDLQMVDAADPMNILLLYPDYQVVIMLDRTMNPISEWKMEDKNVKAVTLGSGQNLWIYDEWTDQIHKIDPVGKTVLSSQTLTTITGKKMVPGYLTESDNYLYAGINNELILVFDLFGQFIRVLPLRYEGVFQVKDNHLIFAADNLLHDTNLHTFQDNTYLLPDNKKGGQKVRLENPFLFCTDPDGVYIYKMTEQP